jgi:hypothetical protein
MTLPISAGCQWLLWEVGLLSAPALSLCCFTCISSLIIQCWEFCSLPHLHSMGQVQCNTASPTVSARLQFAVYVFQFCWGVGIVQSAKDLYWIIFLGGWVGESHLVCDASLFIMQFHTSSFGTSWQGEMALLFSMQHGVEKLSTGRCPGCFRV